MSRPRTPGWTEREKEVALLIRQEKTDQQIAGELGIAVPTVRTHVDSLLSKLGVESRVGIAVYTERTIGESFPP